MVSKKYYLGWDVGGWNCDKNKSSRDAIVILNQRLEIIGKKRGNIRELMNQSNGYEDFLTALFLECGASYQGEEIVLAIDTPLGYSFDFVKLINDYSFAEEIHTFRENTYLFRETERFLYSKRFVPLSAVNHMIGSQSTKGIHFLSKFACHIESLGVWQSNDKRLTVIETYPSANSIEIPDVLKDQHVDIEDAYKCAAIAQVFDIEKKKLYPPLEDIWEKEGWIWVLIRSFRETT